MSILVRDGTVKIHTISFYIGDVRYIMRLSNVDVDPMGWLYQVSIEDGYFKSYARGELGYGDGVTFEEFEDWARRIGVKCIQEKIKDIPYQILRKVQKTDVKFPQGYHRIRKKRRYI